MPDKTKNPGALAGATGADGKNRRHKTATGDGAGQGHRSKSDKAKKIFAWLRAIKRDTRLKSVDARSALDLIEWVDDDLECFRSAVDLAEAIHVVESTAEASLSRLRQTGYIIKIKKGKAPTGAEGGRKANDYRIEIPVLDRAVSTEKLGETDDKASPGKLGKTIKPKVAVSPELSGTVSPDNSGTILENEPWDGAGAQTRPAPIPDARCVIDKDMVAQVRDDEKRGLPALEAPAPASSDRASAPVCDPDAWRSDPEFSCVPTAVECISFAPRREACAAERPHVVTDCSNFMPDDEDFDTLPPSHVGRAPEGAPGAILHLEDDGDLFLDHEFSKHLKRAEFDLDGIYGAVEIDMRRHLKDALDGLSGGNPKAADRFRRDVWSLLDCVHHSRRDAVFCEHLDAIRTLLAQVSGDRRYAETVIGKLVRDMQKEAANG